MKIRWHPVKPKIAQNVLKKILQKFFEELNHSLAGDV